MNKTVRSLLLALCVSQTALAAGPTTKEYPMDKPAFDFARSLYDLHAATGPGAANLVFSPTSIDLALAMTATGARGQTAKQMAAVLPQDDARVPELLKLANASREEKDLKQSFQFALSDRLWLQTGYDVEKDFSAALKTKFEAAITPVDFTSQPGPARDTINAAVAKETHDKIKDLIGSDFITPFTKLVLTNAVYFKAQWKRQFDANDTSQDGLFHPLDGSTQKNVPTMFQTASFPLFEDDKLKLLELPYQGGATMLLVVSKNADPGKALDFESSLADLPKWAAAAHSQRVHVVLPKFKMDASLDLAGDLQKLGMTDAFTDHADFSGITTKEQLAISKVVHKAFIEVNEQGTEAAAATAVGMVMTAMPMRDQPKEFRADRPFVFAIRHDATGEILFLGRVTKP